MKRTCNILILSLGLIIAGILVFVKPVRQPTEWETFQRAFRTSAQAAGFRLLASNSASREQVTPSVRNRIFTRNTNPERFISLYPDVTVFLLERPLRPLSRQVLQWECRSHRCAYQQQGRKDAVALWEAIRKAFPSDAVIIQQDQGG